MKAVFLDWQLREAVAELCDIARNADHHGNVDGNEFDAMRRLLVLVPDEESKPVDMVLHCPACHLQHIDAPEDCPDSPGRCECQGPHWHNPPHRSHYCHGCGHVWRPADVATNGVKAVATKGKADSEIVTR